LQVQPGTGAMTQKDHAPHSHDHAQHTHAHAGPAPKDGVIDPVCGMKVRVTDDTPKVVVDGKAHYFCSTSCRDRFRAAPSRYLKSDAAAP